MKIGVLVTAGIVFCCTFPALAQTPPELSDLVGARGSSGEYQMSARGYRNVRTERGDDRVWTFWWNPNMQTCVTVATMNGRYASITTTPAPDCLRQGGGATTLPMPAPGGGPMPMPVPSDPGASQWFDLALICFGEGQRPAFASRYGYTWDYNKGRYTYGNRTELTAQDFDASVTIQLWEGGGRIRLPGKLIPPVHSRGDHGWWELGKVSRGRDTITAEYRLNGLNKPRMTIDRRSGRISIRGTGDYAFRGQCDTVDNQQRRF